MLEDNDHPLLTVTVRVLEDWAMMLPEQVEPEACPFDVTQPIYMAWVDVRGLINGALSIVTQKNFMDALACNLLGREPEEATDQSEEIDALSEMVNVLAGNYFTEAYGEGVVFDLINPNVNQIPPSELARIANRKIKYYFVADDCPVAVTFSVKEKDAG